jgi:hypothetical protein
MPEKGEGVKYIIPFRITGIVITAAVGLALGFGLIRVASAKPGILFQ